MIHGQANDTSNVMREWSDTAEEMDTTFRVDTSSPWEMIKSRVLPLE